MRKGFCCGDGFGAVVEPPSSNLSSVALPPTTPGTHLRHRSTRSPGGPKTDPPLGISSEHRLCKPTPPGHPSRPKRCAKWYRVLHHHSQRHTRGSTAACPGCPPTSDKPDGAFGCLRRRRRRRQRQISTGPAIRTPPPHQTSRPGTRSRNRHTALEAPDERSRVFRHLRRPVRSLSNRRFVRPVPTQSPRGKDLDLRHPSAERRRCPQQRPSSSKRQLIPQPLQRLCPPTADPEHSVNVPTTRPHQAHHAHQDRGTPRILTDHDTESPRRTCRSALRMLGSIRVIVPVPASSAPISVEKYA